MPQNQAHGPPAYDCACEGPDKRHDKLCLDSYHFCAKMGAMAVKVNQDHLKEWLTKAQAAAAIGQSVKSLERYATRGILRMAWRDRVGAKPQRVCNPEDVAKLLERKNQQAENSGMQSPAPRSKTSPADGGFQAFLMDVIEVGLTKAYDRCRTRWLVENMSTFSR
jgi:hypothetical protein